MDEAVGRVIEVLEEIRPELIAEGGDVKVAGCADGVVYVSLAGPFTAWCRTRRMVLWNIEQMVRERLPWIERVEAVCPPPEDQAW
ncbi:MAG: NifU family protein [Nitrospirota bacterium]